MKRVTLCKVLVHEQDEALDFYTTKLGFEVAEDNELGDYRWLLVRLPDNKAFCLNLDIPRNEKQKALVGRQAADAPLFSIETDDCMRDYKAMKARGVEFDGEPVAQPYGTGVLLKDLYGNRIYMNQDERARPQKQRANEFRRRGRKVRDDEGRRPDERLHAIAGRWDTSGHVIGDPPIPVVGTDIYDVLAGGYFLVHHVDVTVGEQPVRAIEVIGEPDAGGGGYLARSFDSEGNSELMRVTIDEDGVFHFAGGPDIAAAAQPNDASTARVRSTLTVVEDRRSMTALWERSEDGINWQPWMDISFTRSG